MTHTDAGLVALSISIAVVGSYGALDLTRRSADADGWQKRWWIMAAGITMGVGIWSMHFVGMLALTMSTPVSYNGVLVVLSLLAAVLGASVSLAMVTRSHVSRRGLVSAAAFMGFAIAAMHYLGMASMQMSATIHWNIGLVILSVLIGLAASLIALSLVVQIRRGSDVFGFARRVAASVLLGVGVAGLHYVAMWAATFTATTGTHAAGRGFSTDSLILLLGLAAGVMLAVLIGGAAADQRRAALASDLGIVAAIARDLCRVGDARGRICRAVRQLADADYVTLLEPDAHGNHGRTAGAGATDGAQAPRSDHGDDLPLRDPVSVTPPRGVGGRPGGLEQILGELREIDGGDTVHCESVVLDDRQVGLIVIGWHERTRPLSDRTRTLLEMVAAEAAVAIDREDLLQRLEYLSRRDELTGLLNRRAFAEELDRELATASRHNRPLSLVMLDIDRFKAYNDTHGHQAGDRLLKSAAAAWLIQLRSVDLLARYGGEEFIAILPECDLDGAVGLADRLRDVVPGDSTCSAGVALAEPLDTAGALIDRADQALYRAKATGRNRTSTTAARDSTPTPWSRPPV